MRQGFYLELDRKASYSHRIGGTDVYFGGECPNCRKPLMPHVTLDARDERLGFIDCGLSFIPLLYCGRCALSWYDFRYRLVENDRIEIVEVFQGERMWAEWNEAVGVDAFPMRWFDLRPIPNRLQELCDRLNDEEQLSEDEIAEYANLTGCFADANVGGYPIVDVFNQIGGRSFIFQRLHDPECAFCAGRGEHRRMEFLASLCNDHSRDLIFTFDGVQILFFICYRCLTVLALHSA